MKIVLEALGLLIVAAVVFAAVVAIGMKALYRAATPD